MSLIEELNNCFDADTPIDRDKVLALLSELKKTSADKRTPLLEPEEIEFIKMLYIQDRSQ